MNDSHNWLFPANVSFIKQLSLDSFFQKHSQPPVSLHGQLLWREFFYTVGAGTPNFDRMVGNSVCTQVDWDDNDEYLQAWKQVIHIA